jgi:hypothetical protein
MEISKNLKIGLIVGGVAIAGLVVYLMMKKRKNAPTPLKEQDPVKEEDIKENTVVYSKQGTNVREAADIKSAIWSNVEKAGVALPVLDIYPPEVDGKYTWVFIQTPDYKHVGWVRSDAVTLTAPKK